MEQHLERRTIHDSEDKSKYCDFEDVAQNGKEEKGDLGIYSSYRETSQ
jgi:hypothetical protein